MEQSTKIRPGMSRQIAKAALCFFAQCFLLAYLASVGFVSWFFSGRLLYSVTASRLPASLLEGAAYACALVFTALLFAAAWRALWGVVLRSGTHRFAAIVTAAELPLLLAWLVLNKTPDPKAMIPYTPEPIVSAVVTAIIIFPVYSVMVKKLLASKKEGRLRKAALMSLCLTALGAVPFILTWNINHILFRY